MILDPMFRRGVELEGGGREASVGNAQWGKYVQISQWGKVKILAAKYHFVYHTNICKYYFGNAHWGKVRNLAATGQISFPISYKYFCGPFNVYF